MINEQTLTQEIESYRKEQRYTPRPATPPPVPAAPMSPAIETFSNVQREIAEKNLAMEGMLLATVTTQLFTRMAQDLERSNREMFLQIERMR